MRLPTFCKWAGVLAVCLAMAATASAQYGGGGGMGGGGGTGGGSTGGTGTGGNYSSGTGAAVGIGIGVAAGAATGIALWVRHHHKAAPSEALLIGCTESQPNGISFRSEGDGETYMLVLTGKHIEPGERVELKGVVKGDRSGASAFHVRGVVTDFGACSQSQVVATRRDPEGRELQSVAK